MKTIKEVEKEINDITKSLNKNSSKSEVESAKRQIRSLREIKLYLESSPRLEYIKQQRDE